MKHIVMMGMMLIGFSVKAQLSLDTARVKTVTKYHLGASTYFDDFVGHAGYGALVILTKDGGAAAFGDGDEGLMLVKLTASGAEKWKRKVTRKGNELEPQAVVEDQLGNFYVFMLVYDHTKYRGGCERVVCYNKAGTFVWEKYLGVFSAINNPTVSWIKTTDKGISLRGHVARVKPEEGKDPTYLFWEATINSRGAISHTDGDVIDWNNPEWQKKFKPDK